MRRAPNPWDRFYRYHGAPWRGERAIGPLRPWLGHGRVLELGCGNGKLLSPLRAAGFDVIGLDISWHAARRVQGILADAAALPWADGSFSAVLDVHCIGHLDDAGRRAALAEAHRVLQPGGHVVCERLHVDDLRAGKGEQVAPDTRRLADGRTTHFSTEASLRRDLATAGFQVVESQVMRRTQRLPTGHAMRASVQAVGAAASPD